MLNSQSTRRLLAVALSAGVLTAVPAAVPAAASSAAPAVVATSAPGPQAHAAIRSKKYCDRLYKHLRKTNSTAVSRILALLKGCVFKPPAKKKH